MRIGPRFGWTGKVKYQHGHASYFYRRIGKHVYRFGMFTHSIDGRVSITREKVECRHG
jgi:hypothetical protein